MQPVSLVGLPEHALPLTEAALVTGLAILRAPAIPSRPALLRPPASWPQLARGVHRRRQHQHPHDDVLPHDQAPPVNASAMR